MIDPRTPPDLPVPCRPERAGRFALGWRAVWVQLALSLNAGGGLVAQGNLVHAVQRSAGLDPYDAETLLRAAVDQGILIRTGWPRRPYDRPGPFGMARLSRLTGLRYRIHPDWPPPPSPSIQARGSGQRRPRFEP